MNPRFARLAAAAVLLMAVEVGGIRHAAATPVCAGSTYLAPPPCPRVFPEPALSTDWIQFGPDALGRSEFYDGTRRLQAMYPRYIRIRKLADIIHDPRAVSVGIDGKTPWDPADTRDGLPIYVVEVTDFTVPDTGKVYALTTAVHSAEPCGREAMVRTPEDLAIAATTGGSLDNGDIPGGQKTTMPVSELLKREKLIFLYNSPDGWRSGDTDLPNMLAEELHTSDRPSAQSQRSPYLRFTYSEENGRGLNTNRMAPAVGWNFRQQPPYPQPGQNPVMTEPEGIATVNYLDYLTREHGRWPDGTLDIHGTFPGAQVFSADSVSDPRQNALSTELVNRMSANMNRSLNQKAAGLDVAGVLNQNAPISYAQWTSTGTSFDTINYTTSGDQMTWLSQRGAVSALIENNCIPGANAAWNPAAMQVFIDSARAGIDTFALQTVLEQKENPRLDPKGTVGYVLNPDTLASTSNQSPPPAGFPNNPYFPHGLTQVPYQATSMQAFRDYSSFSTRPFSAVKPSDVATGNALSALDTLVIASRALPTDASGAGVDPVAYYANLRRFVQEGGNLVLTDGALRALVDMGVIHHGDLKYGTAYVGYVDVQDRTTDFTRGFPSTYRQTYDPIGLGYQIRIERDGHWSGQPESGSKNMAPIWMVDRAAWESAGGKTIATSDPGGSPTSTSDEGSATNKTALGTLTLGRGRIVVIGALLPDPTDAYPHWFGLESYTPTAFGHHILQVAVTWSRGMAPPSSGAAGVGTAGGAVAPSPNTSRSVSPAPALAASMLLVVVATGVAGRRRRHRA